MIKKWHRIILFWETIFQNRVAVFEYAYYLSEYAHKFAKICVLYTRVVRSRQTTYEGIFFMEKKDLKKLSRSELLEMLLDRSKEVEHLRKQLEEANKHIVALEREVKTAGGINAAIERLNNTTQNIEKFASVITLASKNLSEK